MCRGWRGLGTDPYEEGGLGLPDPQLVLLVGRVVWRGRKGGIQPPMLWAVRTLHSSRQALHALGGKNGETQPPVSGTPHPQNH